MSTRRALLAAGGALAAAAAARPAAAQGMAPPFHPSSRLPDPAFEVMDPRFSRYRIATAAVERVATGLNWAEGPAWFGDHRAVLFSDVPNNRIMRWDEESGRLSTFRRPSSYSNGNARDRQGRLLTCEHATRRVTRTEYDGTVTVLADRYEGRPLNSPNDIICRSDGSIWFTDPAFGPNPHEAMAAPEMPGRVYRIDPAEPERRLTLVADDVRGPNGLCFSPDERTLYVVEARATPNRLMLRFEVSADGRSLGAKATHFDAGSGTPDGMRADADGNLWCGWGMSEALDGVAVFAPDGKQIGMIRLPERCANLVFAGANRNRLVMTATRSVYALYVNARGAPLG